MQKIQVLGSQKLFVFIRRLTDCSTTRPEFLHFVIWGFLRLSQSAFLRNKKPLVYLAGFIARGRCFKIFLNLRHREQSCLRADFLDDGH